MGHLVRQSGFYLVVLFCLVRLYEMLWVHAAFPFMLQIVMLASVCYLGTRARLFRLQGLHATPGEQGVAVLLMLLVVALIGQFAFVGSTNDLDNVDTFSYTYKLLGVNLFWLFAGASMSMARIEESLPRAVVLMAAMAIIVAQAAGEDSLFVDYGQIIEESALENLSHLTVAEFAVCLIMISYASVGRSRIAVFIVGVVILFALGGRSSLYFTILSIAIYEVLRGGLSLRVFGGLAALALALALLFFTALQLELLDEDNRFVQQMLFTEGIEEDESFEMRRYIAADAPKLLPQQILFGDPTLIALKFGYIGNYLHNLLSAWQFFGLPVFLAMVALLWSSWRRMRAKLAGDSPPIVRIGALLLLYTLISVAVSKFVGFRFLWVSIGFWMLTPEFGYRRAPSRRRRRRRRRGIVHRFRRRIGV